MRMLPVSAQDRIEKDSLGEVRVAATALWGAQTQRALENFRIGRARMPTGLVRAIGLVKWAAAETNGELGELPPRGRFRWLVSPRSTMIQASPVHTGRTTDPSETLRRLFECLVRPVSARPT